MAIVIKEIIVKTTVEKAVNRLPDEEELIRRVKERVKADLQDEEDRHRTAGRNKNR